MPLNPHQHQQSIRSILRRDPATIHHPSFAEFCPTELIFVCIQTDILRCSFPPSGLASVWLSVVLLPPERPDFALSVKALCLWRCDVNKTFFFIIINAIYLPWSVRVGGDCDLWRLYRLSMCFYSWILNILASQHWGSDCCSKWDVVMMYCTEYIRLHKYFNCNLSLESDTPPLSSMIVSPTTGLSHKGWLTSVWWWATAGTWLWFSYRYETPPAVVVGILTSLSVGCLLLGVLLLTPGHRPQMGGLERPMLSTNPVMATVVTHLIKMLVGLCTSSQ